MLVARKATTILLVIVLTAGAIGAGAFVLLGGLEPREGITVTTQGQPVVGSPFRFVLAVRTTTISPSWQTYLSLSGLNRSFDMSASDTVGHPWGCANIWNLTGVDLSHGGTFILDTTPSWAAEMGLYAMVWSPTSGFSAAWFIHGNLGPQANMSVFYRTGVRLTTAWPLAASAMPDGPFVLGRPNHLRVSVRDAGRGMSVPIPLYLSVVTKPMYYTVAANGTSENPWNATTLWNLTGIDLGDGFRVDLTATPKMTGRGIGMDVIVWSPRGSPSSVQLDADGVILTPDAVRLWVDLTFSFPVSSV